jgi:hypothetical protein
MSNTTEDTTEGGALEGAISQGDLAARWFLRARARGETFTEEHARRVEELARGLDASPVTERAR